MPPLLGHSPLHLLHLSKMMTVCRLVVMIGLPGGGKREEPKRCTSIGVQIELGSSDWRQFHTSVIKPFVDKGANTKISVSLSATHADGFDRDFIELSIREGATQINRSAKIETDTD